MEMKLELIPLPSKDLEQSKTFYVDLLGFQLDHDVEPGNGIRVIQLTPPGSACSIALGSGIGTEGAAPVKNIHLVVTDIEAVCNTLKKRGLEVSEIQDMGGVKYSYFSDPSGNTWALQEIGTRQKPQ
jgi:catechol 2,3-dioxygenase-like lactoylglutathione lyase family enzyme